MCTGGPSTGEDLPPISKGKVRSGNPAERARRRWFLGRKHSTVLALSRTLLRRLRRCRRGADGLLDCRCARCSAEGQVGTKGWSSAIEQRDGKGREGKGREGSRGDGLPSLMGGIKQGVLLQQG